MSSQRVAKVESIVQKSIAEEIPTVLEGDSARVTLTRVDVAPDLRSAIVWIGLLGTDQQMAVLWKRLEGARHNLQTVVAQQLQTKFVPHLYLRQDTGGAYAAEIERLLRQTPGL